MAFLKAKAFLFGVERCWRNLCGLVAADIMIDELQLKFLGSHLTFPVPARKTEILGFSTGAFPAIQLRMA